jgi:hypothetical protein
VGPAVDRLAVVQHKEKNLSRPSLFSPHSAPFVAKPGKALQNPASCVAPQKTQQCHKSQEKNIVESTERCGVYDDHAAQMINLQSGRVTADRDGKQSIIREIR